MPSESDIVNRQVGGEKLKYVLLCECVYICRDINNVA